MREQKAAGYCRYTGNGSVCDGGRGCGYDRNDKWCGDACDYE